MDSARTGVGGARSHGRCLPDEESELFRRETVEDEQRPLFSTYDDVEVKVDLESLLMNAKYNNENAVKENGNKSNIDSNSNSNSTSTTTIPALEEGPSTATTKRLLPTWRRE